jgi:hypothetical protein
MFTVRVEMKKKIFVFLGFVLFSVVSLYAISLNELRIIAKDGTFLGTFENEYSSNSVYNEYGNYGSKYSSLRYPPNILAPMGGRAIIWL